MSRSNLHPWFCPLVFLYLHSEGRHVLSSPGEVLVAVTGVLEVSRDVPGRHAFLVFCGQITRSSDPRPPLFPFSFVFDNEHNGVVLVRAWSRTVT